MDLLKALGCVVAGVGAVALIPATGGGSIAVLVGGFGTLTGAGALLGATTGAAVAATGYALDSEEKAKSSFDIGIRAGELKAKEKYEQQIMEIFKRLKETDDYGKSILALYAIGLAVANVDGHICERERESLDYCIAGISASTLPPSIKGQITRLTNTPPTFEKALNFARKANLSKNDIDDVIEIITMADGEIDPSEEEFIASWKKLSEQYEFTLA